MRKLLYKKLWGNSLILEAISLKDTLQSFSSRHKNTHRRNTLPVLLVGRANQELLHNLKLDQNPNFQSAPKKDTWESVVLFMHMSMQYSSFDSDASLRFASSFVFLVVLELLFSSICAPY